MTVISDLINESKEDELFDVEQEMHDYIIDNRLHGQKFIDANDNVYFNYLKKRNPDLYRAATTSCAKYGGAGYTPNTQNVMPARSFLTKGVLSLRYLKINQLDKVKLHPTQPIEVITRYDQSPRIYFLDEIPHVRYQKEYGWRIEIRGASWGSSGTPVSEKDALALIALGKPMDPMNESEIKRDFKLLMNKNGIKI